MYGACGNLTDGVLKGVSSTVGSGAERSGAAVGEMLI